MVHLCSVNIVNIYVVHSSKAVILLKINVENYINFNKVSEY